MIPSSITIRKNALPDSPGVYFYYDKKGTLLYIGKATSLKQRVGSYFVKAHDMRIGELVSRIARIDYVETPTVIEALVFEANAIRKHQPPYNVMQKDDKSFLYLCVTNESYPRPLLLRALDLERLGIQPFSRTLTSSAKKKFLAVFGPYTSARSLKIALELIRPSIPWSTCAPPENPLLAKEGAGGGLRPCFDAQIGKCPGVCTGGISQTEYKKIIRQLIAFFSGKKNSVARQLKRAMTKAAKEKRFEVAITLRNRLFALRHILDISLITRHAGEGNTFGRVEAYDIAHISGTSTVAAMVVFESGKPAKSEYRRFRIRTIDGANDVAAMEEVIRRRLRNAWPLPDVMIIDGGEGQVNRALSVVASEAKQSISVIGIAKGFDRKQDRFVYDETNPELRRMVLAHKEMFQRARDEAHRFAGNYHRVLRSRTSGIPRMKKRA